MAAVKDPGLIYVCNPNNPTGTMTSRADLEWLVDNKPAGAIVMIDEAYTHIVPDAFFCSDLVAKGKDVVILRTFSKIYGMAGLRAGAVFARPDLMAKLSLWTDSRISKLPSITGVAAASASLTSPTLIPERKKKIGAVREDVFKYFDKNKFKYVPSVSNCVMVDTGKVGKAKAARPTTPRIQSCSRCVRLRTTCILAACGRALPTYVRVTIGIQEEMERFKSLS